MSASTKADLDPSDAHVERLWAAIEPKIARKYSWRPSRVVAVTALAFMLGGTATAAAAAASPQIRSFIAGVSGSEVGAYAEEYDVTPEQAAEELAAQNEASHTLAALREAAGDRLIGATLVRGSDGIAIQVLLSSGEDLPEVTAIAKASAVPATIKFLYAPTASELHDTIDEHITEWTELIPEMQGVFVSETSGAIQFDVAESGKTADEILSMLRDAGLGQLPAEVRFVPAFEE